MAYREVRIRERGNKLAFRYDPETERVELRVAGELVEVDLTQYQPVTRRLRAGVIGVDFARIDDVQTDVL